MSALSKIRTAGFQVSLSGASLRIEPANKLTTSQVEFLKSHKAEILEGLTREQSVFFMDDRKHCYECKNLIRGACITSPSKKFKPLDDIPRRCTEFK